MPLTIDSIIRQNSGGVAAATSGAPVAVSLAGAEVTEAGNTLVVFLVAGPNQGFNVTPPSGWILGLGGGQGIDVNSRIYLRGPTQGLAAGESSWNFTPNTVTAAAVRWTVFEIEGVVSGAQADILDADSGDAAGASSGTTIADPTSVTSTYDGLALGVHFSRNDAGTDSWSSHTDGFTEIVEGAQSGSGNDVTLSISGRHVDQIGTYGPTATCSRTLTAAKQGCALTFVLNAAGARKAADLRLIDGAEHGVITGNTVTGVANNKIAESASAGVTVASSAARSGGYGWRYASTSAACNSVHYNAAQLVNLGSKPVVRLHRRFPTLPGSDAEMWVLRDVGATALVTVRFITASSKIGVKVGSGSEVVSDTTITANQWFGVDLRIDMSTTAHTVDWRVDYNAELTDTTAGVVQTQATATGTAAPTQGSIRRGWTTSITAEMHGDDEVVSGDISHYPIGDVRILPAKVDPAGTVVLSGTATNFGVMTANWATVSAWNATNARNAVDDIPPDLSGTRDAAVAVLAHATDYIEFPVETIDMAAQQVNIRGVQCIVCLTAASATAATMRLSTYENGNLIVGISEQDPNADATNPVWVRFTVRPSGSRIDWTQARFDGLTLRFGSNDANPDIGIDAFVFEVAVVKAQPEVLFGTAGDPVYVEAQRDPDTQGLVGFTVTTVGAPATVDYEVDGTPDSTGSIAADTSHYEAIPTGGESFPKVNRLTLIPG